MTRVPTRMRLNAAQTTGHALVSSKGLVLVDRRWDFAGLSIRPYRSIAEWRRPGLSRFSRWFTSEASRDARSHPRPIACLVASGSCEGFRGPPILHEHTSRRRGNFVASDRRSHRFSGEIEQLIDVRTFPVDSKRDYDRFSSSVRCFLREYSSCEFHSWAT